MPPQALALAFFIIEEAIKLEPAIAAEIQSLLAKGDPTADDWTALRAKIATKTYADYVPASALPVYTTPAAVPIWFGVSVIPPPDPAPAAATPAQSQPATPQCVTPVTVASAAPHGNVYVA